MRPEQDPFVLPPNLPSIRTAKLPDTYIAAKAALKQCVDMDECKEWENRAAAIASYAKMADDDDLMNKAVRVRAWAIRRTGELLKEIKVSPGKRTDLQPGSLERTRLQAAEDVGLSVKKRNTALRLASIPEDDFDEAVESNPPPTITTLADRGTVKKYLSPAEIIGDRNPDDFKAATQAVGALRRFVELTQQHDPAAIVRGSDARERAHMRDLIQQIIPWINALTHCIGDTEDADTNETRTTQSRHN